MLNHQTKRAKIALRVTPCEVPAGRFGGESPHLVRRLGGGFYMGGTGIEPATYAFLRHLSAEWPLVSGISEGLSVDSPPSNPEERLP